MNLFEHANLAPLQDEHHSLNYFENVPHFPPYLHLGAEDTPARDSWFNRNRNVSQEHIF